MRQIILLCMSFGLLFAGSAFAQNNSRGSRWSTPEDILNNVVNRANDQYNLQDSPLERVNERQWWYPVQYRIANTLDSIRVNLAIYIQWIVFLGLAMATIGLIYIWFLMVTNGISNEWTIEKIKPRIIGIVVWVLLITWFYAVLRLFTAIITTLFGNPDGWSGFDG